MLDELDEMIAEFFDNKELKPVKKDPCETRREIEERHDQKRDREYWDYLRGDLWSASTVKNAI